MKVKVEVLTLFKARSVSDPLVKQALEKGLQKVS